MATFLSELLRGFVGFLENNKILGETRQSDFQKYTPLSGLELGEILRCNQFVFFEGQCAYFMIHFSFRADSIMYVKFFMFGFVCTFHLQSNK